MAAAVVTVCMMSQQQQQQPVHTAIHTPTVCHVLYGIETRDLCCLLLGHAGCQQTIV
jgi:hypothetical protein